MIYILSPICVFLLIMWINSFHKPKYFGGSPWLRSKLSKMISCKNREERRKFVLNMYLFDRQVVSCCYKEFKKSTKPFDLDKFMNDHDWVYIDYKSKNRSIL